MAAPADATLYRKSVLPSGLPLVTEVVPGVRSAALGVWVNTGSRDETGGEGGMAHLLEHLLFKGTAGRSAAQIAKEVDALGGHLDAFTTREFTCFFVSLLDHRLDEGCGLLADIFLRSVFPEREIELERGVVLEEIKMSLDNPEDNLQDLTTAQVWGDNPLARPILGTPASVSSFGRNDVLGFFRRYYHAGRAILACAGSVDHDAVRDMVARRFADVPKGAAAAGRKVPEFRPGVVREVKPLNQVYIDINLPGISQTHELRYPGHVLNSILGGSLSSRLFQKIREERGLVYSIYSGMSQQADCGLLHVSAGTSPKLARQVTDLTVAELDALRRKVPEKDEIRRAKDHLIGNLVLSMESSANRMSKLGKQELYFGRQVTVEESIAAIEAVDETSLEKVAAIFFGGGQISYGFLGPAEGLPADADLPSW